MEFLKYNFSTTLETISGFKEVVDKCNGFTVTNTGDTIVLVNDTILYPGTPGTFLGDSISFGGNRGEIYVGKIKVSFVQPVGVIPQLQLTQKFYVDTL